MTDEGKILAIGLMCVVIGIWGVTADHAGAQVCGGIGLAHLFGLWWVSR